MQSLQRVPCPCAPNESKFSDRLSATSGLGEASEQAVDTCFSAEVSDPVVLSAL